MDAAGPRSSRGRAFVALMARGYFLPLGGEPPIAEVAGSSGPPQWTAGAGGAIHDRAGGTELSAGGTVKAVRPGPGWN